MTVKELLTETPEDSSLSRVLGIIKPDGETPTDEELKQDYIDYLMNKYSDNTFAKIQNGAKTMILKTNLSLNEP